MKGGLGGERWEAPAAAGMKFPFSPGCRVPRRAGVRQRSSRRLLSRWKHGWGSAVISSCNSLIVALLHPFPAEPGEATPRPPPSPPAGTPTARARWETRGAASAGENWSLQTKAVVKPQGHGACGCERFDFGAPLRWRFGGEPCLQSPAMEIRLSGAGNGGCERLGFAVPSPDTCLGVRVLSLTTAKRRGALLLRTGKLGHLHVDAMLAARKKTQSTVPMALAETVDITKERHLPFPWVHLINVSFSPFPSDWFFNGSFAPFPAEAFSPNREIIWHF